MANLSERSEFLPISTKRRFFSLGGSVGNLSLCFFLFLLAEREKKIPFKNFKLFLPYEKNNTYYSALQRHA